MRPFARLLDCLVYTQSRNRKVALLGHYSEFVLMKPGQELYEYSCAENNRCEGGTCTPADVQK